MAVAPRQSLLEREGSSSIESAADWINGILLGELAIGLSVIAVAILGFTLLTGRLNLRLGGRVILGIFVLLGAPAIASAFNATWTGFAASPPPPPQVTVPVELPRQDLPPADYDPYAGASLRRD